MLDNIDWCIDDMVKHTVSTFIHSSYILLYDEYYLVLGVYKIAYAESLIFVI